MNPLRHPGVRHTPKYDVEKQSQSAEKTVPNVTTSPAPASAPSLESSGQHDVSPNPVPFTGMLAAWNSKVEALAGLEARGITRVLHEEKHEGGLQGHIQMFLLWFSINLCANNIITGLFGPLVFGLGWKDSICVMIFACALGSCGPAYTSTLGPESGNRTMVSPRGEAPVSFLMQFGQLRAMGWTKSLSVLYRSLVAMSWAIGLPNSSASST